MVHLLLLWNALIVILLFMVEYKWMGVGLKH